MLKLIDTHTHLQFPRFAQDRELVIERALKNGIGMINVGVDKKSSEQAVELAGKYKGKMWAAVGCHPGDIEKDFFSDNDTHFFQELAKEPAVAVIGECGLDYHHAANNKEKQKEAFLKHIQLAHGVKKPLVVHCREAHGDMLKILQDNRDLLLKERAGVMHFFSGEDAWENIGDYLDLGFYISFSGVITFPNYSHIKDIKRLPWEKILLETDAPFAAPAPRRGQRNEPFYLEEIAKKLAEIKNVSLEIVCSQTTENARKVFGLNFL